jgi:hypothetical protein
MRRARDEHEKRGRRRGQEQQEDARYRVVAGVRQERPVDRDRQDHQREEQKDAVESGRTPRRSGAAWA